MKLLAMQTYTDTFKIEVDDSATEEEIIKKIQTTDSFLLGGCWSFNWGNN